MKQVNYKIVYEINRKYLKLLMCTWFEISSITISRISIFKNVHDDSDKKIPSFLFLWSKKKMDNVYYSFISVY